MQPLFVKRLGLLGVPAARLRVGPVKTVQSLARKMQGGSADQMVDIKRATIYTNSVSDFAFLDKLEAGVPGLKVCRAKVGKKANKWPEDHTNIINPPNLFLNLEMTPLPGCACTHSYLHM
jgi:hypothetical protein